MKSQSPGTLKDGDHCSVVAGTHADKSAAIGDVNTSKTGRLTITVAQANGERFRTLTKNVVADADGA